MKNKSITNWENEEKLKKTMAKTIQQLKKTQATNEEFFTSTEGWNTMWPNMLNITPSIKPQKPQESIVFQSKLIYQ